MERQSDANGSLRPTPEEARAALADAQRTRGDYYAKTNPWWLILLLAGYLGLFSLAPALGLNWAAVGSFGGVLALGVFVWMVRQEPGTKPHIGGVEMVLLVTGMAAVLATVLTGHRLDDTHGTWVWYPVAAVNVAAMLGIDLYLRRRARKAA